MTESGQRIRDPKPGIVETIIKISESQSELATELAGEIAEMIGRAAFRKAPLTIALSGGSTPRLLFSVLGDKYPGNTDWKYVHFFWGDERCVPPDDADSNYGMTKKTLLDKIKIPGSNIHRIKGEAPPDREAVRYSAEIKKITRTLNDLPIFDLIILGLGDDGHTASIFPGNRGLLFSEKICEVASHPLSGQQRVTITGPVINNADNIIFLVTGSGKAKIVADIIEKPGAVSYPAASIEPVHGTLKWYLDIDAASMLSQWA
jgi:6-phosphogluconolactonase